MNTLPRPSWLFGRFNSDRSRRLTSRTPCRGSRCSLGRIVDISPTGARIDCRRFYRPVEGKPARLSVTTPDGGLLHIAATICWTRLDDQGWQAGLAFHGVSDVDARRLAEFVAVERADEARSA